MSQIIVNFLGDVLPVETRFENVQRRTDSKREGGRKMITVEKVIPEFVRRLDVQKDQ